MVLKTKMLYKKKLFLYIIGSFSLILGYAFKENSAGGGLHDFNILSPYILKFSKEGFSVINEYLSNDSTLIHSPFFYYISGKLSNLLGGFENFRIFYLFLCLILPYIYFKILDEKKDSREINIYLLSFLIFLSPYYRTSAIWTLGDNFSLIFFGLFTYFLIKGEKYSNLKYFLLSLIFLVFCSYTRYYYATFWILYIYIIYKQFGFKIVIQQTLFSFILSIPALIYFGYIFSNYNFLSLLENQSSFNFLKNIFQILSILFFYILPFILIDLKNFINFYKKQFKILIITLFFVTLFIFIEGLHYKINLGGGVFYKLNYFLNLNYPIIIFLSVFFSVLSIIYFSESKIQNYILFICLIISFSQNTIYQKYFDPLYLFLFFGLLKSRILDRNILQKKIPIVLVLLYFLFFLAFSLIYYNN